MPSRRETNPHVIPHIFESLQTSKRSPWETLRRAATTLTDTRDVAEVMLSLSDDSHGFQVLNVGAGAAHSVSEIVDLLRRILRRPIPVVQEPSRFRATERPLLVIDMEKRRAARSTPRVALEDRLRDLVAAYGLEANPYLADEAPLR